MRLPLRALLLLLATASCHKSLRDVSDCGGLDAIQKVECGACLLQNKADGVLGVYEYRPDEAAGQRCIKVR